MFRKYGIISIIIIILAELNLFYKVEPFYTWTFPIIWISFIFFLDAVNYKIRGKSLLTNHTYAFLGMFFLSSLLWWFFEFVNFSISNWTYIGLERLGVYKNIFGTIAFSTVLPAFFELTELVKSTKIFANKKTKRKYKISNKFAGSLIFMGAICLLLPFILPKYTFPLVWISVFLILDPINFMSNRPSILKHIKDRKLEIPYSLLLSGIILGILWEFWNFWAPVKWIYTVPFVGFLKIFEMPILGYLGYFGFALELYAFYWFVAGMLSKKGKYLK